MSKKKQKFDGTITAKKGGLIGVVGAIGVVLESFVILDGVPAGTLTAILTAGATALLNWWKHR